MIPKLLSERLAEVPAVLGAWMFLREVFVAEAASKGGYDYVCVDLQHGLHGYETAVSMLTSISTGDAVPFVRAPSKDPFMIGRLVDAGALGVIVPMVNSAEQAAAVVAACRYAPIGERSIGPIGASVRFGGRGYSQQANDAVAVFPMIETVEAVDHVDEIAAVPGIAGLYVGPADLSMSMGLPSGIDQTDDAFIAALRRVVAACEANGIVAGIQSEAGLVAKRRAEGFRMITVGYDYQPVLAALRNDLATAKELR